MGEVINSNIEFDKLQEATNTGWWSANISKRQLKLSSYLMKLLETDSEEISFKELKKRVHPNALKFSFSEVRDLLLYLGNSEEVLLIKTIHGYSNIYIRHTEISVKENGDTWVEGFAKALKEKNNSVQKDIQQDFLYKLYQNIPLGYYRLRLEMSEDGKVIDFEYMDANDMLLEILNIKREDLIGKMYSEIGHFFITEVDLQIMADVAFQGKVFKEQVQFKIDLRYYENTLYSPFHNEVVVLFADVTEMLETSEILRKSQLKLQKIYENIPIGIEVYDKNGYIVSANEKAATMQGFSNKEILLGLNLFEHPFLPQHASQSFKDGKDVTFDIVSDRRITQKYYATPLEANIRYLTIKGTVLYDTHHQIEGYLIFVIDKTELYEINTNLEKAKKKAEESDRLKSQFLSNMSHEIRTPLNAIVGFSDMLASTEDLEEKESYAGIIKRNNELLLQLINDILDLSRIESDRMEFLYDKVDINQIITSLVASSKLKVKSPDLEIRSNTPTEKLFIHTEENRVHQVLSNFVNNALKFTPKGCIEIGYRIEEENIYFYVSDTGKGIPSNKVSDVFQRFVKLDEFAKGTGLGLSICQKIIERLKGEIGVTSEEGKGSTFWFRLPVKPIQE